MPWHSYLKPEYIENRDGGRFVRTLLSRCILVLDDAVNSFHQPSEESLVQSLGHSISVEDQDEMDHSMDAGITNTSSITPTMEQG